MRADVAPETRRCRVIFRSRGQRNRQSTTVDLPHTGRGRGLAVSVNRAWLRIVRSRSRVNGHYANRQWPRLWIIHGQAADTIFPRPQSGHVQELSGLQGWPMNFRAIATCFHPVARTRSDNSKIVPILCPHLIPIKSATPLRNSLRAGHRSSRNYLPQKMS